MKLLRDRLEMLAEQECPERERKERDGQALVCIHPIKLLDGKEVWNHRRLPRNHHRRDKKEEDEIPPFKGNEDERVCRHAADDQLAKHDPERNNKAINQVFQKRQPVEYLGIVFKAEGTRQEFPLEDFPSGHEADHECVKDRKENEEGGQSQQNIE